MTDCALPERLAWRCDIIGDMRYETLSLHRDGAIAEIRLESNAARRRQLFDDIDRVAAALHGDASVHAVLLTAEDGFDGESSGDQEPLLARAVSPFRCLELLPQPVIAVVSGAASDAGLELLLACDIRIAAEDAMFSITTTADGQLPIAGGTQRLARLIGRARAVEMLLLGRSVDAATALAWGLVNEVTPPTAAHARASAIAGTIAARGPLAVAYAKEAILRGLDMPLEQALRYETDLTIILQTTADRAEGVRAFIEKRPPHFEGR